MRVPAVASVRHLERAHVADEPHARLEPREARVAREAAPRVREAGSERVELVAVAMPHGHREELRGLGAPLFAVPRNDVLELARALDENFWGAGQALRAQGARRESPERATAGLRVADDRDVGPDRDAATLVMVRVPGEPARGLPDAIDLAPESLRFGRRGEGGVTLPPYLPRGAACRRFRRRWNVETCMPSGLCPAPRNAATRLRNPLGRGSVRPSLPVGAEESKRFGSARAVRSGARALLRWLTWPERREPRVGERGDSRRATAKTDARGSLPEVGGEVASMEAEGCGRTLRPQRVTAVV